MDVILEALKSAGASLVNGILGAVVPAVLAWFQQHVLPHSAKYQALQKEQLRAEARTWVTGLLAEVGTALTSKGLIPAWAQQVLPTIESLLDQAIETALDKAGL